MTLAAAFAGVTKDYPQGWLGRRNLRALDAVNLEVKTGEVFGLVGPNRAGKTTLVKLLLSLARPTGGQIDRLGYPVASRATLARVGYVHENPAFPRYLTARQLLEFYGALGLLDEPETRRRSGELLARVGLADRSEEPIAQFSKGMVQRLGLAQALLNDPELLVLDEPAEGLDLPGRHLVHEIVAEQRSKGHTVLLVSHQVSDLEQLCDRLAVLVAGRVIFTGSVAELLRREGTAPAPSLEHALRTLYERN